jgi:hypothetical protein
MLNFVCLLFVYIPSMGVHCPNCGRSFKDEACVLHHLNHPMSSCATWHADISHRFAAGEHSGVMGSTASASAIPQPIPQTIPQLNTNDFIPDPTAGFSDDIPPFSEMNVPYPGAAKVFYPGRNPWDIQSFLREVKHFRLNSVHHPFWRDWAMSCPSKFLTIEILHHIHKLFFNHDLKWCRHVLGAEELDFRFSVIQPRVGFCHFPGGVSKLKQATGREHREMQQSIIAVMAGARKEIILCIQALMDFRYLTQSPRLDEDDLVKMNAALQLFHLNKFAITESGAWCSKKSSSDWYIPKLEHMQSTVANARQSGAPIQFTADVTEKLHSVNIKMPVRGQSNNHGYDTQICRHLNRMEKSYNFDLATSIRDGGIDLDNVLSSALPDDDSVDDEPSDGFPPTHSQQKLPAARSKHPLQDLFLKATEISSSILYPNVFATSSTAFSLNHALHMNKSTIDDVAKLFNIPDFKITLADYLDRIHTGRNPNQLIEGRRRPLDFQSIPFSHLRVWYNVRVQLKMVHKPTTAAQSYNVQCQPPSEDWPLGRHDTVLLCNDTSLTWPGSGIKGDSFLPLSCALQTLLCRPHIHTTPGNFPAYCKRLSFPGVCTALRHYSATTHSHRRHYSWTLSGPYQRVVHFKTCHSVRRDTDWRNCGTPVFNL